MPVPKQAAKKAPPKSPPKHGSDKDLRRAHEHQGRVSALRSALGKHAEDIDTLTELAGNESSCAHYGNAADLFRAAEHLSFGLLASSTPDDYAAPALAVSVKVEFQHKLQKAQEHWEETDALAGIYRKAVTDAQSAFKGGAFRKALELVRAAEALAHVHLHSEEENVGAA